MAETAASIIAAATERRNVVILGSSSRGDELQIEILVLPPAVVQLPPTGAKVTKKRGRPARKIAASPKVFVGSCKRLLSMTQASPGRSRGLTPTSTITQDLHTNTVMDDTNDASSMAQASDFQGGGNHLP